MLISSSRKSSRFICLLLSSFYDHSQPGFPGISLSVLCLIMDLITAWRLGIHIGFRRNKAGIQIIALAVQKFLNIGCGVNTAALVYINNPGIQNNLQRM